MVNVMGKVSVGGDEAGSYRGLLDCSLQLVPAGSEVSKHRPTSVTTNFFSENCLLAFSCNKDFFRCFLCVNSDGVNTDVWPVCFTLYAGDQNTPKVNNGRLLMGYNRTMREF